MKPLDVRMACVESQLLSASLHMDQCGRVVHKLGNKSIQQSYRGISN